MHERKLTRVRSRMSSSNDLVVSSRGDGADADVCSMRDAEPDMGLC